MDPDRLIQEQIEYYRQRAPEYDATSIPPGDPLAAFGDAIYTELDAFAAKGDVLEIASGTGTWTRQLLKHANHVTALDAAPQMHEESRVKLADARDVRYIVQDVFSWTPDRKYDVVFFAFWLSHVPPGLFDQFWQVVHDAVKQDGRVFFVDETKDAWRHDQLREQIVAGTNVPIVERALLDGTKFNIVKMFWDPADLRTRLREIGWGIEVHTSGPFFWAHGSRS